MPYLLVYLFQVVPSSENSRKNSMTYSSLPRRPCVCSLVMMYCFPRSICSHSLAFWILGVQAPVISVMDDEITNQSSTGRNRFWKHRCTVGHTLHAFFTPCNSITVFHHSPTVSQSVPSPTNSITKCSITVTHEQYHKVFHHWATLSLSQVFHHSLVSNITKCSITHRQYHKVFHHSPTVSQSVQSLTNIVIKSGVPSLTSNITVFHHSPTVSLSQHMLPPFNNSINKSKMFHHSPALSQSISLVITSITKCSWHQQYH